MPVEAVDEAMEFKATLIAEILSVNPDLKFQNNTINEFIYFVEISFYFQMIISFYSSGQSTTVTQGAHLMTNPNNPENESLDVELNADDLDAISGGISGGPSADDTTCFSVNSTNTTASTCFSHYSEKPALTIGG